jgi:hypothetical protein
VTDEAIRDDEPCPICGHLLADHDEYPEGMCCRECRDWGGPCEP